MYSYDDIKIIENELKKFLLYFGLITILFIGFLFAICRNWGTVLDPERLPVWPAYVLGVIYAIGAVFSWSLVGGRIIKYRGFVYELLTGLDRNIEGEVISIDKNISYDRDLEFYSLEINENEDEQNRHVYLDAAKDIEMFEVGMNVKLKVSGNYVKDILS